MFVHSSMANHDRYVPICWVLCVCNVYKGDPRMSRQREWQKIRRAKGLCIICGDTAADSTRKGSINGKGSLCVKHRIQAREDDRIRHGRVRRNLNSNSYQTEEQNDGSN